MYCPQCGTESSPDLRYCRSCGANLKVIGKALSLGEAIARSDRGPLPKIKEMMKNLKIEQVTEEVSRALDQMNKEIVSTSDDPTPQKPWWLCEKEKTAEQRREKQMVKGTVSLFSGAGLTIFLYYLSAALVLKLPPDFVAQVPFEIDPVVRVLWLVGLVPVLSGVGHIMSGLLIRPEPAKQIAATEQPRQMSPREPVSRQAPASITERTTNILHHKIGTTNK
jgi:hypothetical protein